MKTAIALLLLLCAGSATAQTASVNRPDINTLVLPDEGITFRRVQQSRDETNAPAFFLMETEVTNEMYGRYLLETGRKKNDEETLRLSSKYPTSTASPIYTVRNKSLCWTGNQYPNGKGQHPVALLNTPQATEFCVWLTMKYGNLGTFRLPSVSEWMLAAYGPDRKYPWGNEADASRFRKAQGESYDEIHRMDRESMRESSAYSSEPVKTRPAGRTPEGLFGMWGNVSEFVIPDVRVQNKATVGMGSRWMGGGFGDTKSEPGQDYWGYTHDSDNRSETIGFRVLLDPNDIDHKYKHTLGPNPTYGSSVYGPVKEEVKTIDSD